MRMITSEKSFYIMDYNSNYYRVDSKNQLVAAGSENEATIFSFADANRRIGAGPKSRFYFMTPVNMEDDEVEEAPVSEEETFENGIDGSVISIVREVKEAERSKAVETPGDASAFSALNWEEFLSNFSNISSNVGIYRDKMSQKLGEMDKKICDILHYIELFDISDADAKDLVELLRLCREKRREYKDEIFKAEVFQKNVGTNANIAKAKETIKAIKGLAKRKYTPRKLSELFEGETISARPPKSCLIDAPVLIKPEAYSGESKREGSQMEQVKRDTPFDKRENDWISFAKTQAEFYRNASQYIVNLELEMNEIDSKTAVLLEEIETAKCNVAQGYKMFRRLKELRLARTQKEREWKVVHCLTDNFNLPTMAEECDRSSNAIDEMINGKTIGAREADGKSSFLPA